MTTFILTANYIVLIALAIAFVLLAAGFLVLISRNVKQGQNFRQSLADRVESLKLSKVLSTFQINTLEFLHLLPMKDISHSIDQCAGCTKTDKCDDVIAESTIYLDAIVFCPFLKNLSECEEVQDKLTLIPGIGYTGASSR